MTERFRLRDGRVVIDLPDEERSLLSQVLLLLADVANDEEDPGNRRLNVPVYLDNPEANQEWNRWMGGELEEARKSDRDVFQRVMRAPGPQTMSEDDANALLRVLNEGRLVFAARLGIEVASDHERVPDMDRAALDYMGWILEDLTDTLMGGLGD